MEQEKEILSLLKQIYDSVSKTDLWSHPLIITMLPVVGIIVGSLLTYCLGIKSYQKINNIQLRQKTFGELMGLKFLTAQLYVSRFEALIYSDFHERRWNLAGSPKDSHDFQETKRWMQKSEEMLVDIAKNNNKLFNVLGVIRTLYPSTTEFKELIDKIYNFKVPIIPNAQNIRIEILEY